MPAKPPLDDDEALARALQEEYEREFRRSRLEAAPSRTPRAEPPVNPSYETRSSVRPSAPPADSSRSVWSSFTRSTRSNQPPASSGSLSYSSFATNPPAPSSLSTMMTDEEYARRLENSFRAEEQSMRTSSTMPLGSTMAGRPPYRAGSAPMAPYRASDDYSIGVETEAELARHLERAMLEEARSSRPASNNTIDSGMSSLSSPSVRKDTTASDEEFARRLQQQLRAEAAAAAPRASSRRVKRTVTPLTATSASSSPDDVSALSMVSELTAMEEARRVEQLMQDEELARSMAAAEEARVTARQSRQYEDRRRRQRSPCSFRKICSLVVPILLILAAAGGVVYWFTRGDVPDFFPSPEDFRNEDPFFRNATNASSADRWRSRGQGLELEVISALDTDVWLTFFEVAVSEWNAGPPKVLSLTTSYIDHEVQCDPINFKLKVCNGDYGPTRWRGINKILLTDGYIFASAAKMNDYYFKGSGNDQRQYTMCHEMGHGFGLPHTDEDFTNPDLGNCMDYTINPTANKQPSADNFNFLEQLYGLYPTDQTAVAKNENVNNNGGNRKLDRSMSIPDWVLDKWRALEVELDNHSHNAERRAGWRLLHEHDRGEAHEIDIGGGYSIEVHKILA